MHPTWRISYTGIKIGWGARIRTWECGDQNPVPYHLATPKDSHILAHLMRIVKGFGILCLIQYNALF